MKSAQNGKPCCSSTNATCFSRRGLSQIFSETSSCQVSSSTSCPISNRALTDVETPVFLRLLEYYKGVLFLTTNRVATFDPAFKSRIDLNISYPSLDSSARHQIWKTFTEKSKNFPGNESSLSAEDLDALASLELNGREIKNLVKAGRLLAQANSQSLGMEHVRTALRVQNIRFDESSVGEQSVTD